MKNGIRYIVHYTPWGKHLHWENKHFSCLEKATIFKDTLIKRYGDKKIWWKITKSTITSEVVSEGGKHEK